MIVPADNFILLSLINTKLRDEYSSLEQLCEEEDIDLSEVCARLSAIGFNYDCKLNSFK